MFQERSFIVEFYHRPNDVIAGQHLLRNTTSIWHQRKHFFCFFFVFHIFDRGIKYRNTQSRDNIKFKTR
ncbi:hypothetical protein V1478_010881 [Vespula squamosa]|uniref:Uncharacterized protein n=1 Tax=Vespula squamosa TaxID=30214 RepID=A0ABD2AFL0_VESSQ